MSEIPTIVVSIIGGSTGAALIAGVLKLIQYKVERRDQKADKKLEDEAKDGEKRIQEMQDTIDSIQEQASQMRCGLRYMMLDRICYLSQIYILAGEVDYDDRRRLHKMHTSYHDGLGGNGDADALLEQVDKLPLKIKGGDN